MTRDEAWNLVCQFTQSESLRKHMLAVEAAMVYMARRHGGDETEYAITGLIHDFDYESHPNLGPDGHPFWGVAYLRQNTDLPEPILEAILGHYRESGTPRTSTLARTLFAVDELCGFVTAATLVRPDRNVANLEVSRVLKKMKDKAFAKGVNREDIRTGAIELEIELETLVQHVINALRESADALGLGISTS